MRRWQHLTWKCTLGAIAAVVLLFATLMGLFRLVAPLAPGYRQQVQAGASQALGRPVRIAAVGAKWDLHGPEVTLEKVEILSHDGKRVVVTAREIRLGYTLGAMLHGRFSHPNRINLIQPQLVLERDANGKFGIRGLEPASVPTDWRQEAAEIFAQSAEVLVHKGEVTLIDARRPALPLVFSDIQLNMDNSADNHAVYGRLVLPEVLGENLSFAAKIRGQGIKPEIWQWQVEMQGNGLNMPQILSYWPSFNMRFSRGLLDLRADVSGLGADINRLQAGVDVRQIAPAGNPSSNTGFNLISGELSWNRSAGGWLLQGSNIQLQHDHDSWPVSNFNLQYSRASDNGVSWSGNAGFLRLQDLVTLATWLPADIIPDRGQLLRLSPSGDISNVDFQAKLNGTSAGAWSLAGKFSNLGLHADGRIPGFTNLTGELTANQNDGTLQLSGSNASANFQHLFRGPLTAATFGAHVQFHHDDQGWHISTDDFSAANADLRVDADGTLLLPSDGSSPFIDLHAAAQNVNAKRKSVYLPVGIMPKEVVAWLDSAIVSGQVPSASLILRGRLSDFPFDNGRGLFDIRFHLVSGILEYAPDWPPVQDLSADVEFKNQGLNVAVQKGTLLGDDIKNTTASFSDLRRGVLAINGTARGDAASALAFLRSAPLRQRFGEILNSLDAKGICDVALNLTLPLEKIREYTLNGLAHFQNVSIGTTNLPEWRLSRLNGAVKITTVGISSDKLQGLLLGEPVTIRLRPDARHEMTLFKAQGGAKAAALTSALPRAFQKSLSGSTTWQLSGRFADNQSVHRGSLSLNLRSNLRGLAIDLPAPFGKAPEAALPLSVDMSLNGAKQMPVSFRYGSYMDGIYVVKDENDGWRFDRGQLVLGIGQPAIPSDSGLLVTGSLPELSLDSWKRYSPNTGLSIQHLFPTFLRRLDVGISKFTGFGQTIDNLQIRIDREDELWKLGLTSDVIAGQISLPYSIDNAHPINADMQRVSWIHKPAKAENTQDKITLKPGDLPPLQITVKQLQINDFSLENVKAELDRQSDGVALKSFSIANQVFSLASSGSWITQKDGVQRSTLDVQMKSSDIGKTMQAFGYAPGITAKQGDLQARLNWQGGPFADIPRILNGKLHIHLKDGRLLEVQPGAGRLFGLLSINALPRRLLLNFSDVFGKGFAFDSIQGDFLIEHGDAYTSNLVVNGPAARIHMFGRIGLAKHDFDEALVVDTNVGASLPVLGALAASSVGVGAVLFILTEIFKKPLTAAGETRYHLTGTWDNPVLTKVVGGKAAAENRH